MPRHASPGDPIDRSAATHNAFVDAANALPALLRDRELNRPNRSHTITIHNAGETPFDWLDAVEIREAVFDPGQDLATFDNNTWFDAGFPEDLDEPGALAITTEPIPPGQYGQAVLYGASIARDLQVEDPAHTRAKLGAAGELVSAVDGPALIVWKSETPTDGGETRALVVITHASTPAPARRRARITGATPIDGAANRWEYDFELVELDELGTWQPLQDDEGNPITSDELGPALNTVEASNAEEGTQGNGVDTANLPEGFSIVPIGVGAVVELSRASETQWVFQVANLVDGSCEVSGAQA